MRTLERQKLRVVEDITELVGATPMLHMRRLTRLAAQEAGVSVAELYGKIESLNPGGSGKDRAAVGIIRDAEASQALKPGGTIIEATAGNTGIGLALIGVNRGYNVTVFVPEGFSAEKVTVMAALGAKVIRTPKDAGMAEAIRQAKALHAETPDSFVAGQFENQSNPQYHYETTAAEIWEQMEGAVDAVVIGVGTGGTFSGVSRFMKEKNADILTVAVETEGSVLQGGEVGAHKVEGIGVSFIPKTYHAEYCDRVIRVMDADAFATVNNLARHEGVLAGSSAGANVWAALQICKELGAGKRVATVVPDSAERYLSKNIFEGGI
ncbi:MAG: O-acetylserine dependent cystathionine beta-synthase [Acidobacteriaceae bacterium]